MARVVLRCLRRAVQSRHGPPDAALFRAADEMATACKKYLAVPSEHLRYRIGPARFFGEGRLARVQRLALGLDRNRALRE